MIAAYGLAALIGIAAMAPGDAALAAACAFHKVTAPVLDVSKDAQKPGDFVGVLESGDMACVTSEQTINGRTWGFVQHKLAAGGKIVPVGGWVGLRFMTLQSTAATPKAAPAAPAQTVVAPKPAAAPQESAESAYQAAVELGSCDAYEVFEKHYSDSFHGRLAAQHIKANCQNRDVQANAAAPAASPPASLAPTAPVAPVVAAPVAVTPPAAAIPQVAPGQLAPSLQAALQAVGCYTGGIDGDWGRGSQNALARFNALAGTQFPVTTPSPETLAAVQAWQGGRCATVAAKPKPKAKNKTAKRKSTKKKTASRKKSTPSKAQQDEAAGRAIGTIIGVGAGIALGF